MSDRRIEITLQPGVLRWARERARLAPESLARKLGTRPERVREWETSGRITIAQADRLAHHTHTPVGYLYLQQPVDDHLPIPDLRTARDEPPARPSLELLDTIQAMQQRQAWLRDELIDHGYESLAFVGSADVTSPVDRVADSIRNALGIGAGWAAAHASWGDALREIRRRIEDAGVVVVINGVVGNNTHRPLDVAEFRGFALVDPLAPLIFVNGADFASAQMFTLVHELAHVWIGTGGVSNPDLSGVARRDVERFCNAVAAEVLIPRDDLRSFWDTLAAGPDRFTSVARRFRVSTIVAARRALDLSLIPRAAFFQFYESWQTDERRRKQRDADGGNFWNTQNVRIGHRFGLAIVRAVKEDRLLYRDAYALTGLRGKTFDRFVQQLGAQL